MLNAVFASPAGAHRRRLIALVSVALCLLAALSVGAGRASAKQYVDCQPYSSHPCLFPFPDNRMTAPSRATPTGVRLNLPKAAMPANLRGDRISPTPFDQNDGFSPGSAVILQVPGLETTAAFNRTDPVQLTDMARYKAKNAPIMVIDQRTGRRVMIYAHLDANVSSAAATSLMVQPGMNWRPGHTYIVVLRNLKTASGRLITAPRWFAMLRDGRRLPKAERSQQRRYARIFAVLRRHHVARNRALYATWNFTVASTHSLTYRLLAIRDAAFRSLGDRNLKNGKLAGHAPSFKVTSQSTQAVNADGVTGSVRVITGTYRIPCFLEKCGETIERGFHYSSRRFGAVPTRRGNATAQFECVVPGTATATDRTRIVLYGHGLFGSMDEVTDGAIESLSVGQHMTLCGTNWWGLASPDMNYDASVVQNLNHFPVFVARLQQGVLNTLLLGRLMRSPQGLASNPAFMAGGQSVLNTSELYYDGNSQGGIFGGLTTAISPDIRRGVLGVTGIDYANTLIQRSTDFTSFGGVVSANYARAGNQSAYVATLDLLDQQWDSADPIAYVNNLVSGGLGTPGHQVLMQIAYGDHQVSMYAGAAEAREIGARAYLPNGTGLDGDRSVNAHLFYGLRAVPLSGTYAGSVVEIWDDGPGLVVNPPIGNVPPTTGADPHGDPRNTPAAQTQIGDYLKPRGTFVDVCGGAPCHTYNYTP